VLKTLLSSGIVGPAPTYRLVATAPLAERHASALHRHRAECFRLATSRCGFRNGSNSAVVLDRSGRSLPSDSFRALLMLSTEELGDDRKKRGWSILSLSISRARVRFVLQLSLMPLAWVYISGL